MPGRWQGQHRISGTVDFGRVCLPATTSWRVDWLVPALLRDEAGPARTAPSAARSLSLLFLPQHRFAPYTAPHLKFSNDHLRHTLQLDHP
jgi:hypothetical protein